MRKILVVTKKGRFVVQVADVCKLHPNQIAHNLTSGHYIFSKQLT